MKRNQTGFSLVELLIVITILGIIAAIAVPNLLASRRKANEGSAVSSMRTIYSAEATYASSQGNGEYASMETLVSEKLIDSRLGTATTPGRAKSGYYFEIELFPGSKSPQIGIRGLPTVRAGAMSTGKSTYWIGETGVLYFNNKAEDILITDRTPTNAEPLD